MVILSVANFRKCLEGDEEYSRVVFRAADFFRQSVLF
jgi:hypothetical protein